VDNCRHNAVINRVDERMTELHGDATLLDHTDIGPFDLVMANINRNILLQDMEQFARVMVPDARLVLSGFYQQDCHQLCEHAQRLGLELQQQRHDGEWACLLFRKKL
jgi:ribosomal protein L11 methyltransferase